MVPNNRAVFKNWSDDGGIPNSKSVNRKTSTLEPFKIAQASVRSGTNIVNVHIPRQVVTNIDSMEFKPADVLY